MKFIMKMKTVEKFLLCCAKIVATCTGPELMASTRDYGPKARILLLVDLQGGGGGGGGNQI